jgi:magnesium transporter
VSLAALVTHEDTTPINRLIDDEQPAIDVAERAGSRAPVLRP